MLQKIHDFLIAYSELQRLNEYLRQRYRINCKVNVPSKTIVNQAIECLLHHEQERTDLRTEVDKYKPIVLHATSKWYDAQKELDEALTNSEK